MKKFKHIILGLVLLLTTHITTAQQGINYKAIIRDDAGKIISQQSIVVQFSIYQGDTTNITNIIYQEQFTPTTNSNGLITINIGESTTAVKGDFSTIDWSTNNHSLKTEINIGDGLVNMGITEFKVVPYAKHAQVAEKIVKLPEPYILGRSAQTSNARFSFNGKYGWQAAQKMCEASYPNDPNVRAFTLDQISQAIVLGNWETSSISTIENFWFWAITPYAVGSSFGSYQSEEQNGYGLNYIPGDVGNGTRAQILINDTNNIGNPGSSNPENTYLRVHTDAALSAVYPCMCGTYK